MKRFLFIALIGLLPLWAAILFVAFLAIGDSSSLVVTPWLIIAAVPASSVSLLLVFATLAVYSRVEGDRARKLRFSSAVFSVGVAAIGISIFAFLHQRQAQQDAFKRETRMASEFVARQEAVRSAVGDSPQVRLSQSTISREGPLPVQYDFHVAGPKTVFASVTVDRTGGAARFALACITPLSPGQREAFKDVCAR
jgi:hypothetical protein